VDEILPNQDSELILRATIEGESGLGDMRAKLLSKGEARRIAANIAKLRTLLSRRQT